MDIWRTAKQLQKVVGQVMRTNLKNYKKNEVKAGSVQENQRSLFMSPSGSMTIYEIINPGLAEQCYVN